MKQKIALAITVAFFGVLTGCALLSGCSNPVHNVIAYPAQNPVKYDHGVAPVYIPNATGAMVVGAPLAARKPEHRVRHYNHDYRVIQHIEKRLHTSRFVVRRGRNAIIECR